MVRVEKYEPQYKCAWDKFITESKNGTFLFYRDYMEYHADRFLDHSLLFFDADRLLAVMPANIKGNALVSHGGLTFGGIVSDCRMRVPVMLEVFEALVAYLKQSKFGQVVYKAIPHIYHTAPAEEDLYALFCHGAELFRRDVSATINCQQRVPFSKGRKWGIKQAQRVGIIVRESRDFKTFMLIEEQVLSVRHGVKPVHRSEEITLLASRFPENIRLFAAYRDELMLAGVIIYESQNVAHAQYIAATDEGKEYGALDLIMDFLVNERYREKRYFDFGISTENDGRYLNVGLIDNKEQFGARATVYDFYQLNLTG